MLTSEHILEPITTTQIEQASARIRGSVLRTPIVRLNIDSDMEIYLKLENLQPTGSFKVRGACNAIALAGPAGKSRGVYTCSAGNMAQALAWQARQNGIPCSAIVPDNAPETKLQAIKRYGAKIVQVSFDEVWKVVTTHRYGPLEGSIFIHPFSDERKIAGNGTIGLEILEDIPDVDSVVIPFGGGGRTAGIATAIHERKPDTRDYAVEPDAAAPLAASFSSGRAMDVTRVRSLVDGRLGGGRPDQHDHDHRAPPVGPAPAPPADAIPPPTAACTTRASAAPRSERGPANGSAAPDAGHTMHTASLAVPVPGSRRSNNACVFASVAVITALTSAASVHRTGRRAITLIVPGVHSNAPSSVSAAQA